MTDKRMGEVFAQDRIPLPRYDPRRSGDAQQRLEELQAGLLQGSRYPQGQLSVDAGVGDIGNRPFQYGKPESYIQPSPEELHAIRAEHDRWTSQVGRGLINPERFRAAQQGWPESPNAVWSFDDRFRGTAPDDRMF
jgi:hypothetical protein